MGRGIQQTALVELALDLDQAVADLPQQADTDRLVVDEGAAAPVGAKAAPEHQRILAGDPRLS